MQLDRAIDTECASVVQIRLPKAEAHERRRTPDAGPGRLAANAREFRTHVVEEQIGVRMDHPMIASGAGDRSGGHGRHVARRAANLAEDPLAARQSVAQRPRGDLSGWRRKQANVRLERGERCLVHFGVGRRVRARRQGPAVDGLFRRMTRRGQAQLRPNGLVDEVPYGGELCLAPEATDAAVDGTSGPARDAVGATTLPGLERKDFVVGNRFEESEAVQRRRNNLGNGGGALRHFLVSHTSRLEQWCGVALDVVAALVTQQVALASLESRSLCDPFHTVSPGGWQVMAAAAAFLVEERPQPLFRSKLSLENRSPRREALLLGR